MAGEKFQNLGWRVARLKLFAGIKRGSVCKVSYQLAQMMQKKGKMGLEICQLSNIKNEV